MKTWILVTILLVLCAVLIVGPLVLQAGADFGGADGKAEEMIAVVNPEYEPWFETAYELPGETETLLFCIQTAIGVGILTFGFGYLCAKKKYQAA